MQASNIMALDVGTVRIGVALASDEARLPSPFKTVARDESSVGLISEIIRENNVSALVIGLPRNLEGNPTAQTSEVEAFANELRRALDIPIIFQDEALTSVKAKQELEQKGVNYQKSDIDSLAATYILEDYLKENNEENK